MLVPDASFEVYARHRDVVFRARLWQLVLHAHVDPYTYGGAGADVPGCIAIRYEDVEAAASIVAVRCVGEERLQAISRDDGDFEASEFNFGYATRHCAFGAYILTRLFQGR